MPPKDPIQKRRESSAPPDSLTPKSDAIPGDLRREDPAATAIAPDLPAEDGATATDEDVPLATQRPSEDGGNAAHPVHDDDPDEDFTPGDYEEQIDEVADARKSRRARDIASKS